MYDKNAMGPQKIMSMFSASSEDTKQARSDYGFCIMPSCSVRLLQLSLLLFATRGEDMAQWLGVTRQRINQWTTGREPMPVSRQELLFQVMSDRVQIMREFIFDGQLTRQIELCQFTDNKQGTSHPLAKAYIDMRAAKAVIELMEEVLREEDERLNKIKAAAI